MEDVVSMIDTLTADCEVGMVIYGAGVVVAMLEVDIRKNGKVGDQFFWCAESANLHSEFRQQARVTCRIPSITKSPSTHHRL